MSSNSVGESSSHTTSPAGPTRKARGFRRVITRIALLTCVAGIGLIAMSISASTPDNLGVRDGKLAKCPESPNCVSTQAASDTHRMEPIPLTIEPAEMVEKIKSTVGKNFSRAVLVEQQAGYLRYEFSSLVFRFVDDVEFFVDDKERKLHFRSASRVGHSDLGANRRRMNLIRKKLTQ